MSDLPPPVPPSTPGYPSAPLPYAPVYRDRSKTDADQLRLLSIFSYVSAGLAILGLGFLGLHYTVMSNVASNPDLFRGMPNHSGPNPAIMFRQMFGIFRWFYVVFAVWGVVMSILNVIAGYFLGQRQHRMFGMVVAALNCLRIPLGTALGIFTLMVLSRDSVRALYEHENAGSAASATGNPPLN